MDINPQLRFTASPHGVENKTRKDSDWKHDLRRPFINTGKLLAWAFTGKRPEFTKTARENRKTLHREIHPAKHQEDRNSPTVALQGYRGSRDAGITGFSSDPGLKLGNPHPLPAIPSPVSGIAQGAMDQVQVKTTARPPATLQASAKDLASSAAKAIRAQCEKDDSALEDAQPEPYDPDQPIESEAARMQREDAYFAPYRQILKSAAHELVRSLGRLPNPTAALLEQLQYVSDRREGVGHEIPQAYRTVRDGIEEAATDGLIGDWLTKAFKTTVAEELIDALPAQLQDDIRAFQQTKGSEGVGERSRNWASVIKKEHAEGKQLKGIPELVDSAGSSSSEWLQALGWSWRGPFMTTAEFPADVAQAQKTHGKAVYDTDQRRNDFNDALRAGLVAKLPEEDRAIYKGMTSGLTQANYSEVQQRMIKWIGYKVDVLQAIGGSAQ